jgi:acyl dehydratase
VHAPGRTVTEADNVLFTTLTMNTQSLHLDAAWAAGTEFGERLVNSMFTLSTLVGLSVAQLTQGTIVANLGFGQVAFPAPVRVGDTLYAETVVVGTRLSSSRPGQGIVEFAHTMRNQRGDVVATATRTTLMRCLPAAATVRDHPSTRARRAIAARMPAASSPPAGALWGVELSSPKTPSSRVSRSVALRPGTAVASTVSQSCTYSRCSRRTRWFVSASSPASSGPGCG